MQWIIAILFSVAVNVCVLYEWWGAAAGTAVGAFCVMICILIDVIEEKS